VSNRTGEGSSADPLQVVKNPSKGTYFWREHASFVLLAENVKLSAKEEA
jgi:hypothetical protein